MQEQILETTLNGDNIVETEITAIQKDMVTDHSQLTHLDYESSGHTGFQPAGNYIEDDNYTHTDNNYTTEEKTKLASLQNYDDTEIRSSLSNKVDKEQGKGLSTNDYTNEEKNKLAGLSNYDDTEVKSDITSLQNNKQNKIDSNNKLSSDLVDDTNNTNKFVTSNEKTTWNNKSDFSGNYNDLTNKPTIPDELKDLSDDSTHRLVTDTEKTTWNSKSDFSGDYNDLTNKPTIPVVPTNVSAFTNDAGYLTSETDPVFSSSASAGITSNDITGWNGKQEALVSGTNIKTINNTSILGSGNIEVGGSSVDVQINGTSIVSNDVANILTETSYNSSTNKIATMTDVNSKITYGTTDISEGDPLETGTLYCVYE